MYDRYVDVPEGTTAEQVFAELYPGAEPQDFDILLRKARVQVASDKKLSVGESLIILPRKWKLDENGDLTADPTSCVTAV